MVCPDCEKEDVRSKVSLKEVIAAMPFYDEEGRFHSHSQNPTEAHYICTKGHEWVLVDASTPRCMQGDWP